MTRRRLLAAVMLIVLAIVSIVVMRSGPDRSEIVRSWLLCDECSDGELSSVIALGEDAIPLLTEALRVGPDSQQRANVRSQLSSDAAAVNRVGRQAVVVIAAIDTTAFLDRYLTNYVRTYQERALLALTALKDSAPARKAIDSLVALDAVTQLGWSDTLRAAVQAHRTRVSELRILPIEPLRVGQTRRVRVQVIGGDSTVTLTWSSSDSTVAIVAPNRVVTGYGAGQAIVRACWTPTTGGGPPICAIRAVRVTA